MAGASHARGTAISAINVTPFVDIVLVLLVVLMVTSVQIVRSTIDVDLPSAASGGTAVNSTLNLVIDEEGNWQLDGKAIGQEQLATLVATSVKEDPKVQAIIAADKNVKYDNVVLAIDVVKSAGIKSFALNIQSTL